MEKFVEDKFAGDSVTKIKNTIAQTEIKNALSSTFGKVTKFNLKIYAYVYDELVYFPYSDISYETFQTNKFFINVHLLITVKVHLHHSHITGKILGYAHDFCNTIVIKNTTPEIPLIAHYLFGFDLYYFIKGYTASAWCSTYLNIGDTTLRQINFGNISGEIKLIDTLKFYQKSLADLASTLSNEEKIAVKKLTERFLNEHYYLNK